jgi:hypothetical protein
VDATEKQFNEKQTGLLGGRLGELEVLEMGWGRGKDW